MLSAERCNARLKDEFSGRKRMLKDSRKVMIYLMFGPLVLSAEQARRLRE